MQISSTLLYYLGDLGYVILKKIRSAKDLKKAEQDIEHLFNSIFESANVKFNDYNKPIGEINEHTK